MTKPRLEARVALVTGAGGDIGRAIAIELAREGAAVACADLHGEAATETAAAVEAEGGAALALECDVGESAHARRAIEDAVKRFSRLHVLVNNAAYFPPDATLVELAEGDFDRAFAVNVGGCFLMSRFALPHIAAAGGGSIIHVASQQAHVGRAGQAAYCATKAALLGLAKAMALDHARERVRVNTLSPGGIATRGMAARWGGMEAAEREWGAAKHPLGRLGRVEEVARAAVFLASDDSSFMTGADLLVDGGYTAW